MEFFDSSSFMPHGHCYLWRPDILWLHVVSDAVIGLAYASIPFVLVSLVRKRRDLAFTWAFLMFGVFILACGVTHFMEIWTVWNPSYGIAGVIKGVTALASLATAVALWPLLPKVLALPSPSQLADANAGLQLEIIERQRVEAALEQRNAALIEAEKVKRDFLANVSHELRTPLTLILAPTETMLEELAGSPLASNHQHNLQVIHNNALRLLQMVNSLLDFAKLEANKMEVTREPLHIENATQSILKDFEPIMHAKSLACDFESQIESPVVMIDRYLYERIMFNLLSNAVKFTPEGGSVGVTMTQRNDRLQVDVRDSGVGIAPEDQQRLFEKFHQLEDSATRRFEGTGIGLALVKEFTRLLGGQVDVKSTKDIGSTFSVALLAPPFLKGEQGGENDQSLKTSDLPPPQARSLARQYWPLAEKAANWKDHRTSEKALPRVLLAEDNPELASYVTSILHQFCLTRIARDGEEALRIAHEWRPDLLLSDVMMPKLDGITLCRTLKADPHLSDMPIVLLTAHTQRQALLRGWEAGADEYLFKPFHPTELMTRIRTILVNVGDKKRAVAKAQLYTTKLEAANRELEAFSYSVSHDLRAPLRAIDGFANILLEDFSEQLSPKIEKNLGFIADNTQQMMKLIDDLLSFSRTGQIETRYMPLNLKAIAEDVVSGLRERAVNRIVEWNIGVFEASVAGDPDMIRLVFQNLLDNALKYTRPRDLAIIDVSFAVSKDEIVVAVRDNGVGFDTQYSDRLFGVFQRLHTSDEFEGTGVGLANVSRIIGRHGGRVWAEGRLGGGATFFFSLPTEQIAAESGG